LCNLDIEKKLFDFSVKSIREIKNGSNKVFLCELLGDNDEKMLSIYKPIRGERPLRDFFVGNLSSRELAAYEISKFLGWPNLPPLVIKEGPFGEGSFQKFIDHDPKNNYFNLFKDFHEQLKLVMIFDSIILNTDRKAGSIILDDKNKIWAIDQALTFNPFTRLRTVMFEYNKMEIPERILSEIKLLIQDLENQKELFMKLSKLISEEEVESLIERSKLIHRKKIIPELDPYVNVPYPLI
tara:strand:+ start:21730 stop:22446 length:717 start_codon:yes stop_codon:yes gene_type:complete